MAISGAIPPELERMFDEFREFLYETSGIYFGASNRVRLLSHVQARMKATGADDPKKYLEKLKRSPRTGGELVAFFNQVTVNETYFFREEIQFQVLKDKVLPDLYRARKEAGRPRVNIWSAACSSGEEAYSLAILIKESFPAELPHTSIVGFDINSEVIEKAKKGVYGAYSVRHCTEKQQSTYFKKKDGNYELVPYIRRLATFRVANFSETAELRSLPKPDLIFCRNVLIYFDKASKGRVLANLGAVIQPHGLLFLSNTETLFGVEHPFEMVNFFRVRGYRLKKG